MILITVQDNFRELIADQILKSAAETVLLECGLPDSPSLLIRITDDEELNTLNLKYRGIDKTTDVLSFPADFEDPDLESRYVGDVVIAFPRAEEQAQKRGHFVEAELQLLVVHGTLHLLGYDHGDKTEKKEMWSIQSRILEKLGLDIEVEDN
ncbi:MAG: rRNA maturation RNase YbeY [Anaerolineales bacterium]|nr:rRNA maturation RNase YbeY [Anaerolineales bacterium]